MGFSIVIPQDEQFGGEYHFTEAYTASEAHEMVFAGDAVPSEEGVNT